MSRAVRLLIAVALPVTLAACKTGPKPADLPPRTVVQTDVVTVERIRYVPIRAELTREHPIAEGPLSQCPDVAAARKAELIKANAKFREIRAIQGGEAKP